MWGPFLFALLIGGFAVAYWPMLGALHGAWSDKYGAHSHGYLVLALAVWFAVRAWRTTPRPKPTGPEWSALPALILLLGAASAAEALFVGPIRTALLPPLLLCCVALCLGRGAALRLAWPVLFLYLAIPAWGLLTAPLQELTTKVSQALVKASGIPVFVEGSFVHLPAGTFEIASGCSGLNYLIAALTLAAVHCTLYLRSWRARGLLVLAAVVAALAANWLRVTSLIAIGHFTGMKHYLIRVDHLYYGWALFLMMMVPVLLIGRRLEAREELREQSAGAPGRIPDAFLAGIGRVSWSLLLLGVVAAGVLSMQQRPSASQGQEPGRVRNALPVEAFTSGWAPRFERAVEDRGVWTLPARGAGAPALDVYTAAYARQSGDARVSLPENSVTGPGWQTHASEARTLADGTTWIEMRGALSGRESLLWVRQEAAGRDANSKFSLRVAELLGLLTGRRDAMVLAIRVDCRGNCEQSRELIAGFLNRE